MYKQIVFTLNVLGGTQDIQTLKTYKGINFRNGDGKRELKQTREEQRGLPPTQRACRESAGRVCSYRRPWGQLRGQRGKARRAARRSCFSRPSLRSRRQEWALRRQERPHSTTCRDLVSERSVRGRLVPPRLNQRVPGWPPTAQGPRYWDQRWLDEQR